MPKSRKSGQGQMAAPLVQPGAAAGIDMGASEIYVAVPTGRDSESVRSFDTFTPDLVAIAEWLERCGIRTVAMDLATVYRSIVKRHFPKALIVADRFHVIRLINHHFLACWREIDPVGAKNRGLISLMRRHRHNLKPEQKLRLLAYLAQQPALHEIYRFKQRLCYLLLKRHKTRRQCQKLVPRFLRTVLELRQSGLQQLVTLGDTLHSWSAEIARMWRFTRSNGITEGFDNKMETISRQAYGFRNFQNYRQRVQVLCG